MTWERCAGLLHYTLLILLYLVSLFCFFDNKSVRLPSLYSTCVTYGTLCHARGHQVLPTQLLIHSHVTYVTPCHAKGHSHTHMWLTWRHAMPEVTHTLTCGLRDAMPRQRSLTHSHQVLPTPAFNVIPHPSVSYHQVFRLILYFHPSSSQGDSRLCPNLYLGKHRISLGVTIILSICLCPHT